MRRSHLVTGFVAAAIGLPAISSAALIGLGQAANFAVLGLQNTNLMMDFSNDTVYGNVGLSGNATLSNMAPSTINGDIYRESTTTVTGPGTINGTTHIQSMTSINNDAFTASSTDGALAATQTFGNITTATTVNGNGGINVIDVNGSITLGGTNSFTLNGTASDIFVVNITGTVTMNGSSQLGISGGVTNAHVLYNFIGASGNVSLQVGNQVHGTMLGPNYSVTNGEGTYLGGMIFGGTQIKLLSGASVTNVAFTVPEPASLSVLGLAAVGLLARRRRD